MRLRNTRGVTDEHCNQRKVEVSKRVDYWWTARVKGKKNLIVRYGGKPFKCAEGKNATELGSEAEFADVLAKLHEAAELSELDALIEKQAQFVYILRALRSRIGNFRIYQKF